MSSILQESIINSIVFTAVIIIHIWTEYSMRHSNTMVINTNAVRNSINRSKSDISGIFVYVFVEKSEIEVKMFEIF